MLDGISSEHWTPSARITWTACVRIRSHSCADALAWIGESVDEGLDCLGRVLASERLDVERRFRPSTRITGSTWRPRTADDLLVHHSADPMLI